MIKHKEVIFDARNRIENDEDVVLGYHGVEHVLGTGAWRLYDIRKPNRTVAYEYSNDLAMNWLLRG